MLTPSLALLLSFAAPLAALLPDRNAGLWRPYLRAALPLFAAAFLSASPRTGTNTLRLATGQVSELMLPAYVPFAGAALLLLAAFLLWLQARKAARQAPRAARWLAAPLSLAPAAAVPLAFAAPYLFGFFKWEFAPPVIKAMGVIGLSGLALCALAALALAAQLILGFARPKRDETA